MFSAFSTKEHWVIKILSQLTAAYPNSLISGGQLLIFRDFFLIAANQENHINKALHIIFLSFSYRPIANPWKLTTAHNLSTNLDTRPWVETIFAKLNVPLCWMHWTPRAPPRVKRDHIRTFSSSQTPFKLQAFSETSVKSSTVRYFLLYMCIQTISSFDYSVFLGGGFKY